MSGNGARSGSSTVDFVEYMEQKNRRIEALRNNPPESKAPTGPLSYARGSSYSNELADCDTRNKTIIDVKGFSESDYWPAPNSHLYTNKKKMYIYLDRMNSGLQNGPKWQNKRYETYTQACSLMRRVADRVEMSEPLLNKAISMFAGLDRSKIGRSLDLVALAVCGYVLHEEGRRRCHPNVNAEDRDEAHLAACAAYGWSVDEVDKMYYKIAWLVGQGLEDPAKKYGPHDSREYDYVDHEWLMNDVTFEW
jgi:hypothetical protein